ncbi:MAG: hypothetical protein JO071_03145 [Deltaproteobacteria bacterium]|nr:hypothetical protein [Deltaproteobacteria bacterium]
MINPIEIILRARNRLARFAVIRTLIQAALPLAVTVAIALELDMLNALAFDHFGYLMDAAPAQLFQRSLLTLALVQLVAAALFAWRARSHASDFIQAAEQIDRCVGGRQEIVTLATLSDPSRPAAANMRSPLFPMLWARATAYLEAFDPRSAFTLELRAPLMRSFILAAITAIFLSTAAFALMTRPTPAQAVNHRLQLFANRIDTSAPNPARQQLAAAARDVAKDLLNPKLPPQEKLAELRALEHELEKSPEQHQAAHTGNGNSSGAGNGSGRSGGQGASDAGRSSGSGKGSGVSQTGSGAGNGAKANQQIVELHNDIAKAQVKLEQEAGSGNNTTTARNDSSHGTGAAPEPGTNRNQPGGQNSSNGSGQVPQPQTFASSKMPSGQSPGAHRSDRGSMGDTHLGEFPKPGNYQRFYKSGEPGTAINMHDARYVTFQLPTEIESAGTGVMVPDNTRPQASAPYTNSPLKQERLPISPDEQQLVPPRYRELIH